MAPDLVGKIYTRSQIKTACDRRDRLGFETHLCGGHRPCLNGRGIVQSFAVEFGSENVALFRFEGVADEQLWRLEEVYQPWFARELRLAVHPVDKGATR